MERLKIFTFWEPHGNVPPYLELCRETWDTRLTEYEIVCLDYSNLEEYLGAGTLDLDTLKKVRFAAQKDALEVAVLHRHGGLFMDMDTLVVDDLAPILQRLDRTGVVMFEQHMAFVAARQGAPFLARWLAGINRNLARIASGEVDPATFRWDFLGNAPLHTAYLELLDRSFLWRTIRRTAVGKRFWPSAASAAPPVGIGDTVTVRASPPRWRRIGRTWIGASVSDQLIRMDRAKDGFIAEAWNADENLKSPPESYRRFWFEGGDDVDTMFRPGVRVIGLHHSWTPDWYRNLSRHEVLNHRCRLSQALRRLLDGR